MSFSEYIKQPANKLGLILILIVLLPALIYTAYEINTMDQKEQLLSDIYQQQLNVILFSVNQYTWDYVNNWVTKIDNFIVNKNIKFKLNASKNFLSENSSLVCIYELDLNLDLHSVFSLIEDNKLLMNLQEASLIKIKEKRELVRSLKQKKLAGYQKIEPIIFTIDDTLTKGKMILTYIPDSAENDRVIFLLVDIDEFIQVISKKLVEVAGEQFAVAIFNIKNQQTIFSNTELRIDEVKQTKKIWLFPDYALGIKLKGQSVDNVIRERFYNNLVLIFIVDFILLIGVFFVFRNVRKQMELARLKSDFVSNVSHELRTPLALIRMYAESLEMDRVKNDSKKNEYYQVINQESERLTRLINNILNFSRIESGKKEYNFRQIDLNQQVQKILDMYEFHLQSKGFKINSSLQEGLEKINADEEAISETIINLIDNAVKYSEDKKEIEIKTWDENSSVFFEIRDNGIGIKPENQKLIFDKFYRVSSTEVHDTKGSGLGLSLVKHIIDAHKGKIFVESKLGKGSCFKIQFNTLKDS